MTTQEPMNDARLAELESWFSYGDRPVDRRVRELVAEVRRGRASRLVTDEQLRKGAERIAQLEAELVGVRSTVDRVRELARGRHRANCGDEFTSGYCLGCDLFDTLDGGS